VSEFDHAEWVRLYREARASWKVKMSGCYNGLSTRAAHILANQGIESKEGVREAYEAGKLQRFKHTKDYIATGVRGLGKMALREIAVWAGIELPAARVKKVKRCPHCGREL
jgi:hypothetical protein